MNLSLVDNLGHRELTLPVKAYPLSKLRCLLYTIYGTGKKEVGLIKRIIKAVNNNDYHRFKKLFMNWANPILEANCRKECGKDPALCSYIHDMVSEAMKWILSKGKDGRVRLEKLFDKLKSTTSSAQFVGTLKWYCFYMCKNGKDAVKSLYFPTHAFFAPPPASLSAPSPTPEKTVELFEMLDDCCKIIREFLEKGIHPRIGKGKKYASNLCMKNTRPSKEEPHPVKYYPCKKEIKCCLEVLEEACKFSRSIIKHEDYHPPHPSGSLSGRWEEIKSKCVGFIGIKNCIHKGNGLSDIEAYDVLFWWMRRCIIRVCKELAKGGKK